MSRRSQIINRAGQEHRQELAKLIKQTEYKYPTWQIWDDLMYFSAAALSQPGQWVQEREDEYLRRIGLYDKETQTLFPQMFGEIVLAFEQEGLIDVLGDMYMQLELHNKWKGQFFTPSHVCELMAKMVGTDTDMAAEIERQGYTSVTDPCCGGGAMLIAYAKVAQESDINYQTDVLFVGQDIDPVVARMCYISMALLGMPGYVIIGNSLLMDKENWDYWFTPMYFIHGFQWRQRREKFVKTVAALTPPQDAVKVSDIPETENPTLQATEDIQAVEYNENKVGQLTLFSA